MTNDYFNLPALELAALVRTKKLSAAETARRCLDAVTARPEPGAFLCLDESGAQAAAEAVDKALATGEALGPLAGVPVAVADNICVQGLPATCASRMLAGFHPPTSATAVEKLAAAGAMVPGKTNLDEFGVGSSCESSYFGPTRNPWNLACVPGGASGGAAAAVAAGLVPLALGVDTGGSLRQPAAFCGLVGLRPSYGAVSRRGLVALAPSMDQIGPLGCSVRDVALLFSVLCGEADPRDATSRAFGFSPRLGPERIKGLKIGLPKEYFGPELAPDVRSRVEAAAKQMEALGAQVAELSLPSTPFALAAYTVLSSAEAASSLARYDGVKYGFTAGRGGTLEDVYLASRGEGFDKEVKRRILLGTQVLAGGPSGLYARAEGLRHSLKAEFAAAFESFDLLLTPTAPTTAFNLGEKFGDPLAMAECEAYTAPASLAGLTAASLPCGLCEGLPAGFQLIGPRWSERRVLSAALAYEEAVGGFPMPGGVAKEAAE